MKTSQYNGNAFHVTDQPVTSGFPSQGVRNANLSSFFDVSPNKLLTNTWVANDWRRHDVPVTPLQYTEENVLENMWTVGNFVSSFYFPFDAAISFKNNNLIQFYSKCILEWGICIGSACKQPMRCK